MARCPTYAQMCAEAIASLRRRRGSSMQAIAKFLQNRYGAALPATAHFRRLLCLRLKRLVHLSLLLKSKASYKLTVPARRLFLHQSYKRRHVQCRASEAAALPPLVDPAALSNAGLSDGGVPDMEITASSSVLTSDSSGQCSISSINSGTSCSSVSPRRRRRSLLKELHSTLRDAHWGLQIMTMGMNSAGSCRRRRLRRYGVSLLRPI